MAKKTPVMIWIIKQTPRSDPKFQANERLTGAGRSTIELLTALAKGCDLRSGDNILFERS
jgi:hypothetical protein